MNVPTIISLLALILSGVTAAVQLIPQGTTYSALTSWNADYRDDKLQLTSAIVFVNGGNKPSVVSELNAIMYDAPFGFEPNDPKLKCRADKNYREDIRTWISSVGDGEKSKMLPLAIPPGSASSNKINFGEFTYGFPERGYLSKAFCLSYKMINYDGEVQDFVHPIGIVKIEKDKLIILESSPDANRTNIVVPRTSVVDYITSIW